VMERLKLVLQYFQSNSESISNGICIILALVSVKLYTSFDFNCPCLPQYNKLYSLGVMIVPPIILFFLGILVNRHTGVMMDEWMRPIGNRSKNPAVVKYLFSAMIQRALLAPMVWILVTLLDGKIFICAFSVSVDPALFSGLDVLKIMAKVPCKEDVIFRNSSFRKAVSRYVRCHSQVSSQPHKQSLGNYYFSMNIWNGNLSGCAGTVNKNVYRKLSIQFIYTAPNHNYRCLKVLYIVR
uniref:Calcium homeostasis modulator 3 n=1 Tax=Haplochromis burtoni TaxID=8153 RepID=A0A3Q2VA93_HAPBU